MDSSGQGREAGLAFGKVKDQVIHLLTRWGEVITDL